MKTLFSGLSLFVLMTSFSGTMYAQTGQSVFSGTIWTDTNGNGVQDAGENGIPGVLVELRGGASQNTLQSAVISDATGSYNLQITDLPDANNYRLRFYYPNEAFGISTPGVNWFTSGRYARTGTITVSGSALNETLDLGLNPVEETLTFSNLKPLTATNWGPHNISLPQSPVGYGVLKEVRLYYNLHVLNPSATVINSDGENSGEGSFQTSARFNLVSPFDEELFEFRTLELSADIPLAPLQELTAYNLHSSLGGEEHVYDPSYISNFVGGSTFDVSVASNGYSAIIIASGNLTGSISTVSGAGIFVVYIYEEGSLPVKLSEFTAHSEAGTALLRWSTTEEINSSAFEIERRGVTDDWRKIGERTSAGNTNQISRYHFVDNSPLAGINYYRLKMIDVDGTYEYSAIASLESNNVETSTVSVYPNPVAEVLFIQNVDTQDLDGVAIIGSNGQVVSQVNGYNSQTGIKVSELNRGLYFLRYKHKNGEEKSLKFLITR